MIISISEARKIIGESHKSYTDEQIEEIIHILTAIADLAIDDSLAKRTEKILDYDEK